MRILLFLAALLMALPASAQTYFREGTTHWLDIDSTARTTTTSTAANTQYVRLVLSAADEVSGAYYAVAASGSVQAATVAAVDQATASYLPPRTERIIKVGPGNVIVAITVSGNGLLVITELTQ